MSSKVSLLIWSIAVVVMTAGCTFLQQQSEESPSPQGLQDNGYDTGATTGSAALGRQFSSVDELVGWYSEIATCPPADVKRVQPQDVDFHLATGMVPLITEVAVCGRGYGDILGLIATGREREFQEAYKSDLQRDPVLWAKESHRLMMGNGFFLMNNTGDPQGLSPMTYGVLYLRCDPEAEIIFDREEFPADAPGCLFVREAYGYAGY